MKRIEINQERCKGCSYCVAFCKNNVLVMTGERNSSGLNYVRVVSQEACNLCSFCIVMCPDQAITLYRGAERDQ